MELESNSTLLEEADESYIPLYSAIFSIVYGANNRFKNLSIELLDLILNLLFFEISRFSKKYSN